MANGTRKYGRCKERPSNKRYTAEQRWVKNKALSIKRESLRVACAALRKLLRKHEQSRDFSEVQQLRKTVERLSHA